MGGACMWVEERHAQPLHVQRQALIPYGKASVRAAPCVCSVPLGGPVLLLYPRNPLRATPLTLSRPPCPAAPALSPPQATVLLLLAHWVDAHPDLAGNAAVMQFLCREVRAAQLPFSYVQHVLYGLPWFHISHLEHLDLLSHIRLAELAVEVSAKVAVCADKPGWFRPARPQPLAAIAADDEGALAVFRASLDYAIIAALVNSHSSTQAAGPLPGIVLPLGYSRGYEWSAGVVMSAQAAPAPAQAQPQAGCAQPEAAAGKEAVSAGLNVAVCLPQILQHPSGGAGQQLQQQYTLVPYEITCSALGKVPLSGRARAVGPLSLSTAAKCVAGRPDAGQVCWPTLFMTKGADSLDRWQAHWDLEASIELEVELITVD
jgi:hypothetical protein